MQKTTHLREVPNGTTFTLWGRQFTKLEGDEQHSFVLQASVEEEMPFQSDDGREDRWNDFERSDIRNWLENEYIERLREAGMKPEDIAPLTVDLKCTLGQREYGSVEVMAGLLTLEQYGEYYDIIPLVDDWWWLATPWKTPSRSPDTYDANRAWLVLSNGNYSNSNCSLSRGVRPALNLNSLLLVSWDDGKEQSEEADIDLPDDYEESFLHGVKMKAMLREINRRIEVLKQSLKENGVEGDELEALAVGLAAAFAEEEDE